MKTGKGERVTEKEARKWRKFSFLLGAVHTDAYIFVFFIIIKMNQFMLLKNGLKDETYVQTPIRISCSRNQSKEEINAVVSSVRVNK